MQQILQQFSEGIKTTTGLEYFAVFTGIASVWFSRKENILVYPVGLISTIIYIYFSVKAHLIGEASVNLYYTIMSVYGWVLWIKKDNKRNYVLNITKSSLKEWKKQLLFFTSLYVAFFAVLTYLKQQFTPGAIPWADAFASATAYTGMWLMANKKIETWYWYIATNIASIPLYFVKHYVFTSIYFLILLLMAFWGLSEWRRRAKETHKNLYATSPA